MSVVRTQTYSNKKNNNNRLRKGLNQDEETQEREKTETKETSR